MRKSRIWICGAVLLVLMSFVSCGSAEDDPIVGAWEMSKVKSTAGQEMTIDEFMSMFNSTGQEVPVLTFKKDHTVSIDMLGTQGEGKWELEAEKYHVTDDTNTSLELTLKGDVLSVEQSGAILEFKKRDESGKQ